MSALSCSMDDFEVCSNGGAETPVQTAQNPSTNSCDDVTSSLNAPEAQQSPADCQVTASRHEDAYGSDDDHFSDVGDAPDTEVATVIFVIAASYAAMISFPVQSVTPPLHTNHLHVERLGKLIILAASCTKYFQSHIWMPSCCTCIMSTSDVKKVHPFMSSNLLLCNIHACACNLTPSACCCQRCSCTLCPTSYIAPACWSSISRQVSMPTPSAYCAGRVCQRRCCSMAHKE